MKKWEPMGPVSPLPIPENCVPPNVMAVWIPVGEAYLGASSLDLSNAPLVDPTEASKFVTQKRASEHAAGRYALASLLRTLGFEPNNLQIIRDEYRKPKLMWRDVDAKSREGGLQSHSLPEISLGHSNGIAVAAVSLDGSSIGLDAEPVDACRSKNILTMMASGKELQYLEQLWMNNEDLGIQESTRTWVVKEAVQKACGLGMHIAPQSFSVLDGNPVSLIHEKVRYNLEFTHWQESLDNRTFRFGFSKLIESVSSNL
jgi:phosphopantetheinyl transferase